MNLTIDLKNDEIENCLSIDVEGFVESNLQSFHIQDKYVSKSKENYEIEKNVNFILEFLDEFDIKGTFFFLGRIAQDIPNVVTETAQCGHEIACHSHKHLRIFGLTKEEFKKNLICAKKLLEDVSGKSVWGFRAPEFSITNSSIWALDILKEVGFVYDSSIYPTGLHDVYGISGTMPFIHKLTNGLIEFPLSTIEFLGRRFPFGGGGHFRLYPLMLTKLFIRKVNRTGNPCMIYIHPYELGPVVPNIPNLTHYRKFRHYYNCKNGSERLKRILQTFKFSTAIRILKERNLQSIPRIVIFTTKK